MDYLWSDAWLFQAIALASQAAPARLSEVIGAADAVNHALPTADELHGALVRLTAGGFLSEAEERFTITELVPVVTLSSIRNSGLHAGRRVASKFLRAEEWTPERNIRDPRNQVVYEGLTDERLHAAEREYRQRLKSTER